MSELKHRPEDYIRYDPFEGDMDVDIQVQKIKLVKVRKPHVCYMSMGPGQTKHEIQPGEIARYEKALADGTWGESWVCIPCMDAWFDDSRPVSHPYATAIRDGFTVPLIGVPASEGQEWCVKCADWENIMDMKFNEKGEPVCRKCGEGGE